MNLKEKAALVVKLTEEIVEEGKTLENKQLAGLFSTFGPQFNRYVQLMSKWLEKT